MRAGRLRRIKLSNAHVKGPMESALHSDQEGLKGHAHEVYSLLITNNWIL